MPGFTEYPQFRMSGWNPFLKPREGIFPKNFNLLKDWERMNESMAVHAERTEKYKHVYRPVALVTDELKDVEEAYTLWASHLESLLIYMNKIASEIDLVMLTFELELLRRKHHSLQQAAEEERRLRRGETDGKLVRYEMKGLTIPDSISAAPQRVEREWAYCMLCYNRLCKQYQKLNSNADYLFTTLLTTYQQEGRRAEQREETRERMTRTVISMRDTIEWARTVEKRNQVFDCGDDLRRAVEEMYKDLGIYRSPNRRGADRLTVPLIIRDYLTTAMECVRERERNNNEEEEGEKENEEEQDTQSCP